MVGSRPQSHSDAISMENSLELSTTVVHFWQQQKQQGQLLQQQQQWQQQQQINQQPQEYYKSHKWKSKLWRRRFRWDQFEITSSFSFVASYAFFGDKSVQVKVINFIK